MAPGGWGRSEQVGGDKGKSRPMRLALIVGLVLVLAAGLGAFLYARTLVATIYSFGDVDGIWDCDPMAVEENRPRIEQFGCMVPVPGPKLVRALTLGPTESVPRDVHAFLMGAQSTDPAAPGYDTEASDDEAPPHRVTLSPFWIHMYEVTVDQYRWCTRIGPCSEDDVGTGGYFNYERPHAGEHPVNGVNWHGAEAYCGWIGGRLPTEAEWEFTARAGGLQRRYPWTGESELTCGHLIFGGGAESRCGIDATEAAGYHPPLGEDRTLWTLHMAGNVWEWTADWYDADYYARSPQKDPQGPHTGTGRVQRGGGWSDADPAVFRGAFRAQMDPTMKMPDVGFRCVADAVDHTPARYRESFSNPDLAKTFQPIDRKGKSNWTISQHALRQSGDGDTLLPLPSVTATSGTLVANIYAGSDGTLGLAYALSDDGSHYALGVDPKNGVVRLSRVTGNQDTTLADLSGARLPSRRWMSVVIQWTGAEHYVFVDANPILTAQDDTLSGQGIGLWTRHMTDARFDDVAIMR